MTIFWELKSIEEPELEKRLGEEYIRYRERRLCFSQALGKYLRGENSNSYDINPRSLDLLFS